MVSEHFRQGIAIKPTAEWLYAVQIKPRMTLTIHLPCQVDLVLVNSHRKACKVSSSDGWQTWKQENGPRYAVQQV